MAVPNSAWWTDYWYWLAAPHVPRGLLHRATDSMPHAADFCVCRYRKSLAPRDANRKFFFANSWRHEPQLPAQKKRYFNVLVLSPSLPLSLSPPSPHAQTEVCRTQFASEGFIISSEGSFYSVGRQLAFSIISEGFIISIDFSPVCLKTHPAEIGFCGH